jgi:acyl carrier protein
MNTQSEIERFILDDLLSGSRPALAPDEPLVSTGTLDSLGMLRLITFLEERFGMTIGDGDVGEENFGTLNRLVNFVEKRQRASQSPTL